MIMGGWKEGIDLDLQNWPQRYLIWIYRTGLKDISKAHYNPDYTLMNVLIQALLAV